MPNRILRDGINSSPRINALSPGAEILYRRLMSVADDYGRFYAAPGTIRGACWPTSPNKVKESQISRWMIELQSGDRPLLKIYTVKGCLFLEIDGFDQRRRSKSKYPEPLSIMTADCGQPADNPPQIADNPPQNDSTSRSRISESETKAKAKAYNAPSGAAVNGPIPVNPIFDHWNLQQRGQVAPPKHRSITSKIQRAISARSKAGFTESELKQAITRYFELCLEGTAPGYNHWSLDDLLSTGEGKWVELMIDPNYQGIKKERVHDKGRPRYIPKQ